MPSCLETIQSILSKNSNNIKCRVKKNKKLIQRSTGKIHADTIITIKKSNDNLRKYLMILDDILQAYLNSLDSEQFDSEQFEKITKVKNILIQPFFYGLLLPTSTDLHEREMLKNQFDSEFNCIPESASNDPNNYDPENDNSDDDETNAILGVLTDAIDGSDSHTSKTNEIPEEIFDENFITLSSNLVQHLAKKSNAEIETYFQNSSLKYTSEKKDAMLYAIKLWRMDKESRNKEIGRFSHDKQTYLLAGLPLKNLP